MTPPDPTRNAQTEIICRYYNGCSAGDLGLMQATLHPDVVHYFLAPNVGSRPVAGREHLARYWRKVARAIDARWVVERSVAMGREAAVEWTMFWTPPGTSGRIVTRGSEWFIFEDDLIREIRSYHQQRDDQSTELEGFSYAERGYSHAGEERSALHPEATDFSPEAT
jgi:ketosteroid isomerase-like protein